MIGYPWASLFTGIMLLLAGGLTLSRHFLLESFSGKYPKAPAYVRHTMYGFGVVLLFLGLRYIWVFASDFPNTIPPQPDPSIQLLSTALVIQKAVMFANVVRQRYPEAVWTKLNRITDQLQCDKRKQPTYE